MAGLIAMLWGVFLFKSQKTLIASGFLKPVLVKTINFVISSIKVQNMNTSVMATLTFPSSRKTKHNKKSDYGLVRDLLLVFVQQVEVS